MRLDIKPYHPVDSLGGKLMDEDTSGSQTTRCQNITGSYINVNY
jgi:hypothetical protein